MKTIAIILTLTAATGFTVCNGQQAKIKTENSTTQMNAGVSSPFTWTNVDESSKGVCKPITKEQRSKVEKTSAVIFKEYETINEYPDAMEFVYADANKYATLLLDFVSIEKLCCPAYTFFIKFSPDSKKVSLIVGGSPDIKELVKEYVSTEK